MGRRVRRRSAATPLLGLLAAWMLAGCNYLFGFDPTPPDFAMPSPAATYREGHATVTVGEGAPIVLDQLGSGGIHQPTFGAEATFRNADGWYVRVMGAMGTGGMFGQTAYVTLDRIVGLEHWTTYDPSRCIVTVTKADDTGLVGTATCKGLRWADALSGSMGALEPPYVKGQPPFDAEITFEATPTGTLGRLSSPGGPKSHARPGRTARIRPNNEVRASQRRNVERAA